MKSKRLLAFVLASVVLFSLAACGSSAATPKSSQPTAETSAPTPAETAAQLTMQPSELSDIDTQLKLIYDNMDKLQQPAGELPWYYAVTDLDHDGSLEFVAASQHPADRSTNLKIWAVSKDRKALTECTVKKDAEESFPDIMTESADTFHVKSDDTWNYLFYDNVVLSDNEVITSKSAFKLKDGVISYEAFAVEHTVVEDGVRTTTHTDMDGDEITGAEYNASGVEAFADAARSSTSFEWLTKADVKELTRLVDSYAVFMGVKKAPETFPVPKPAAANAPEATAAPAPTAAPTAAPVPVPAPQPVYLEITKNPTNEPGKKIGGTALFVAGANVFDYLTWTMVSPYGAEYSLDEFANMFPNVSIYGYYSTTLSISNLIFDVGGWGAYCTFFYQGQIASTTTAYMYVSSNKPEPKPEPVPEGGVYYGSVYDWNYSTVSVNLDGTTVVALPWDICNLSGDIYYGAPATAYWNRTTTKGLNFYYCQIQGEEHMVGPVYGSMSGNAYSGGGGYAIKLLNGTEVFVDAWNCNVTGNFYEGAPCVVYYVNYPSTENAYQADIYGDMGLIIPDGGGWAGSQYYANEGYAYDSGNSVPVDLGWDTVYLPTHVSYNYDGSTYEAIWCPDCGSEVSLAMEYCPFCGRPF